MSQQMEQPQILQEEEQTYTFEDICPEWNQILSMNGGFIETREHKFESDGDQRNMMNYTTCLVGEAHSA